jgi:hypothetical protein
MSRQLPMVVAVLWATAFVGSGTTCSAQNTEAADGKIITVAGQAEVQIAGHSKRSLSKSDEGMRLKAGDRVQCFGLGSLVILLPSGLKKIAAADGSFVIRPIEPDPAFHKTIIEALANYGVAGATRGNAAPSRILWPSQNSAVTPEHFVIRWEAVPQKITVSIMSDAKDTTIWGPTAVDGNSGLLQSKAISAALAGYKMKSASPGLVLTITFADPSDWEEAHFSLLTGTQEQELHAQLDFWGKQTDGLALRFGRGYSFSRHKLFAEAAEEYESALSLAPESRYLLEDAIQANRLAGRASRVKELQSRLASLPEIPNQ